MMMGLNNIIVIIIQARLLSLKSGPNIREIGMDAIPKKGSGLPSIMLDQKDQDKMALCMGMGTRRVQNGPEIV